MSVSQTSVATPNAEKYLTQLCQHWGHRFPVTHTPYEGWVPFRDDKVCKIDAEDGTLRLRLSVSNPAELDQFEKMVEEHVQRFAFREGLAPFEWLRGQGEGIPAFVDEDDDHHDFHDEPTGELRDWTIRVNGRKVVLTYAEGPGDALLLLHGLGGSARSFVKIMPALEAAGYRPIAVNMPGYGGSDPLAETYPTPQELADHLRAIMDEIALQRADVLGHSLGGVLAASLTRYHPERVGRVVLSSPPKGFGLEGPETWDASHLKRVEDLLAEGPEVYASKRAAALCSTQGVAPEAIADVEAQMARLTPEGLRTASSLFARADLLMLLEDVDLPIEFISAEFDRIVPATVVTSYGETFGRPVQKIDGVGHAAYVEDSEAFVTAVLTALERMPVRSIT